MADISSLKMNPPVNRYRGALPKSASGRPSTAAAAA
jgi:hypothetical protein